MRGKKIATDKANTRLEIEELRFYEADDFRPEFPRPLAKDLNDRFVRSHSHHLSTAHKSELDAWFRTLL